MVSCRELTNSCILRYDVEICNICCSERIVCEVILAWVNRFIIKSYRWNIKRATYWVISSWIYDRINSKLKLNTCLDTYLSELVNFYRIGCVVCIAHIPWTLKTYCTPTIINHFKLRRETYSYAISWIDSSHCLHLNCVVRWHSINLPIICWLYEVNCAITLSCCDIKRLREWVDYVVSSLKCGIRVEVNELFLRSHRIGETGNVKNYRWTSGQVCRKGIVDLDYTCVCRIWKWCWSRWTRLTKKFRRARYPYCLWKCKRKVSGRWYIVYCYNLEWVVKIGHANTGWRIH